jgi:hypothetical protein
MSAIEAVIRGTRIKLSILNCNDSQTVLNTEVRPILFKQLN